MKYDLEEIINNPKANATIFFPSNGTPDGNGKMISHLPISGLVETDFSLDIVSSYSDVDTGLTGAAQTAFNASQTIGSGANRIIKNVQQTLQRWNGHTAPSFTVPIIIVKYKKDIDILDIVRTLVSAPAGTYDSLTLKAPYGYGWDGKISTISANFADVLTATGEIATKFKDYFSKGGRYNPSINDIQAGSALYNNISQFVKGTWTLKYSDWFLASDLIITHVSATISKETVKGTNEPLYARINVTFTTAYLPDARTIADYFLPAFTDQGSNTVAGQGNNNNAPL